MEYLDSAAINALAIRAEQIKKLLIHPVLVATLTVSGLAELVTVDPIAPDTEVDR